MMWMIVFWVFFIISLVTAMLSFSRRTRSHIRDFVSNIYVFGIIMMGLSLLMSIATKDPFLQWLPIFNAVQESGWEVALSVVIFAIFLFSSYLYIKREYLKPLRRDITNLQTREIPSIKRDVALIDERTRNIQKDVTWIRDNCKVSLRKR